MELKLYGKKTWLYQKSIDFRRSIDGLISLVQGGLNLDPREGIYIFLNRSRDRVKMLSWHKNGFVIFYKRLETGRFHVSSLSHEGLIVMEEGELKWFLAGLDWYAMRDWKELKDS